MRGLIEYETTPVPGTEGGTGDPGTPPAAEPSTTETGNQPPETIPYARFKEVNDKLNELKGFESLTQMGYDSDSLESLAAFEAAYFRDPIATMETMVDNLDLPDDRKEAVKASLKEASGASVAPAEGEPSTTAPPSSDEPPAWAKPLLEDHQRRSAADAEQERNQLVDKMVDHWKQLDQKDRIKETPDRVILRYIASMNPRGDLDTIEKLAEAARMEYQDERETILGEAVQRPTGLRSVPGSGVAATPPQEFGGDIKAATKAARAAIEAGQLQGE